jgi:hypothetical protein
LRDLLRRRFANVELPRRDDNVGTRLGERLRYRATETTAAAGDHRNLVRELEIVAHLFFRPSS